jgi:undecaprenyl-diphosphatase
MAVQVSVPTISPSAVLEWVTTRDHHLMRKVNRWTPPGWLRLWMVAATRGGDGWLWWAMGFVILVFGGHQRFRALAATGAAVSSGIALFIRLKRFCNRKRPCAIEPHCWATLLPPDQFSFPSGHTITAFAVMASMSAFYPGLLAGLLFGAVSVALSRILLGMHFLSDVLAGAAIGTGLAYVAVQIFG